MRPSLPFLSLPSFVSVVIFLCGMKATAAFDRGRRKRLLHAAAWAAPSLKLWLSRLASKGRQCEERLGRGGACLCDTFIYTPARVGFLGTDTPTCLRADLYPLR